MGYQVTEVQKALKGFDSPGSKNDLAKHAESNGAESGLVETLRGLNKDSFDGPNAVMSALGAENVLGGSTRCSELGDGRDLRPRGGRARALHSVASVCPVSPARP